MCRSHTVCASAWMITPALALGRLTAAATAFAAACDSPCSKSSHVKHQSVVKVVLGSVVHAASRE